MVSYSNTVLLAALLALAVPSTASGDEDETPSRSSPSETVEAVEVPEPYGGPRYVIPPYDIGTPLFYEFLGEHPFFENDRGDAAFLTINFSFRDFCTDREDCSMIYSVAQRPDVGSLTPNDIIPLLSELQSEEGDGLIPHYIRADRRMSLDIILHLGEVTLELDASMGSRADFRLHAPSQERFSLSDIEFADDGGFYLDPDDLVGTLEKLQPLIEDRIFSPDDTIAALVLENHRRLQFAVSRGAVFPDGNIFRFRMQGGVSWRTLLNYTVAFPDYAGLSEARQVIEALQFQLPTTDTVDAVTGDFSMGGSVTFPGEPGTPTHFMGVDRLFASATNGRWSDDSMYHVPQDPMTVYSGVKWSFTGKKDVPSLGKFRADCSLYGEMVVHPSLKYSDVTVAGGCHILPYPLVGGEVSVRLGSRERILKLELHPRLPFQKLGAPLDLDVRIWVEAGKTYLPLEHPGLRAWNDAVSFGMNAEIPLGGVSLHKYTHKEK